MKRIKDPVSSFTHLFGAAAAIPLTMLLIHFSMVYATVWHVVAFSVFGASLFLLYAASAVYHMLPLPKKWSDILRRIDHMMIFVLIAGTYTPICLLPLRGVWGWTIFGIVWGIAVLGIILKAVWMDAPRWLSTGLYIFMGWIIIIAFYPLANTVTTKALVYLIAGGVVYTAGGIIYALKRPKINSVIFGFHELFHLFVMGGSVFHILLMFQLIFA